MKAQPAARGVALFIGLVLIALGCVAGRELWVLFSHTTQSSWLEAALRYARGAQLETWMFIVAGALAVLAVILLVVSLKPRRTTHVEYHYGDTTLHVRRTDVARLLTASALDIPGVRAAESTVGKRKATVNVTTETADSHITERVQAEASQHLEALESPLSLNVHNRSAQKEA